MNVWIINHYAFGPGTSGGTRHYDLAKELVKHNYSVTIFASSFHHQEKRDKQFKDPKIKIQEETYDGVRFVWIKAFPYLKNDWRRMINMLSYTFRVYREGKKRKEQPHVIIGSLMHPFAALAGYVLARLKGSTFYFEERDLWPETLIGLGRVSRKNPIVRLLKQLELFLYKKADQIIVLFEKAVDYVEEQGIEREKVLYLPNGVDLKRYDQELQPLPLNLEELFCRLNGKFIAVYIGAHGISNHLDTVLETAQHLNHKKNRNIHFLFVGNGPEKEKLVKFKEKEGLDNVTFFPPVEKELIPSLLKRTHAGVMCLKDVELYKWGISFNKMYDYMAASLPIILLSKRAETTIERSSSGVIVDSPVSMMEAIERLAENPSVAIQLGRNGRCYVEQYHSWEMLSKKLIESFEEIVPKDDNQALKPNKGKT